MYVCTHAQRKYSATLKNLHALGGPGHDPILKERKRSHGKRAGWREESQHMHTHIYQQVEKNDLLVFAYVTRIIHYMRECPGRAALVG
jgi:hypothetical protein